MKYRVIGWTYYEDDHIETAGASDAAVRAIIEEIRARGYLFTGWHHQEGSHTVPVLNDGKKRLFSTRTLGAIMAEAHGYHGMMDYALFADYYGQGEWVEPRESYSLRDVEPIERLRERFTVDTTAEVLAAARETGSVRLPDSEALAYLDVGDLLVLKEGEEEHAFLVKDVERKRDLTPEEARLLSYIGLPLSAEERAERDRVWREAKTLLCLTLLAEKAE